MQLCRLPAYSPDFNADEAIWAWVRAEVTANTCLGIKATVQERVDRFLDGLKARTEGIKTRCRTKLQALAATMTSDAAAAQEECGADHAVFICAEGLGLPLVAHAINRWSVLPHGDQTLLSTEAEVDFKGGPLGRLLGLAMAPLMGRMAPGALAGFKYLVEHGRPYDGKAGSLPRPPAYC